jgi:hypothetical protein
VTLSMGAVGRAGDAVHFRPCERCRGLSHSSTHPYALRLWGTVCGWSYVIEKWRRTVSRSIPPRKSCTWPDNAVMRSMGDDEAVVCFDLSQVYACP